MSKDMLNVTSHITPNRLTEYHVERYVERYAEHQAEHHVAHHPEYQIEIA